MSAYYNENDPKAAAWLHELIKAGLIAAGEVDERSILDVIPGDLRGFAQCHFFAGIGGWSYALRLAGVADTSKVWTASCPCQPFSTAGKGAGFADERHLWPYFFHLFREVAKPAAIRLFGEQVASKDSEPWIDLVQADLEGEGYRLGLAVFPSAGVGAPHGRHRTYFVADATDNGHEWSGISRGGRNGFADIGAVERLAHLQPAGQPATGGGIRAKGGNDIGWSGEIGGLADLQDLRHGRGKYRDEASPERQDGFRGEHERLRLAHVADDSGIGGMEHPIPAGSQGYGGNGGDGSEPGRFDSESNRSATAPGPVNGFWGGSDWVLTRAVRVGGSPSLRPVEPGTFPLVDGAPARVGRLRGYGNAITVHAAKEFIQAYLETQGAHP